MAVNLWFLLGLAGFAALASAQEEQLNIWIVAHSHDDTGWLRTVDEYYIYEVQYILDSVTDALAANPNRKFVEVEMAFFSRWWREQTAAKKELVRKLVDNRQLVFVNGGWCMNDDAVPMYYAMIDQMTLGHEFIRSQFGESAVPTIGWHIDPFGHSNVIPTLYNLTGFDAWYINRIDFREKNELKQNGGMEFWWRGSKTLGNNAEMWIHIMDSNYCTPSGFNWEHGVTQDLPSGDGPTPVVVNPPSAATANNELQIATNFVNMARQRATSYTTNNILVPFGCDFTYQNANMMFKNIDRLIDAVNKYSSTLGATARYSSLDDYVQAVKPLSAWPSRQEDFFPYADDSLSYWTGYFTSRQTVKATSRTAHSVLRNAEFIHSLARAQFTIDRPAQMEAIFTLKAPEAVVQHHDGVTGTFRELVGRDYLKLLNGGKAVIDAVYVDNLSRIATGLTNQLTTNESSVDAALREGRSVVVLVHNSLSWTRQQYVRLFVSTSNLEVVDSSGGRALPFQINARSSGGYDLFVRVSVPPLGYTTFIVEPVTQKRVNVITPVRVIQGVQLPSIENEYIRIEFNNASLRIGAVVNKRTGAVVRGDHDVYKYTSWNGYQPSGAYIFRPIGVATPLSTSVAIVEVLYGSLVTEIRTNYQAEGSTQITRLYNGLDSLNGGVIEVEHTVGPLTPDSEIILRFNTDINNSNEFYTDSNGLELQRRLSDLNGRPGDGDEGVRIAGNYYPAVSRTFIRDASNDRQFTVVSQTTHGVSSLANGQLEVMIHRRCSRDDARGMNEALNDADVITSQFRLIVDNAQESARLQHHHALEVNFPLGLAFSVAGANIPFRTPLFSPFKADLPENVHLVSFNPRDATTDEVVLRLLNPFEAGEHPSLSQPVTIDLSGLLAGFVLENLQERTLTLLHSRGDVSPVVTINPIQIRTFVATVRAQ